MNINDEVFAGQAIIYRSSLSSLLPPQELGSVFALLEVNNYLDTINNRRSILDFMSAGKADLKQTNRLLLELIRMIDNS